MRLMLAGDVHGNTQQVMYFIKQASDRKITHIFFLGDFGLWDHFYDGVKYLDDVNAYAESMNVHLFVIGGNHENWDRWLWYVENNPTSKGFAYLRSRVLIAPKAHQWRLANKTFAAAGGAVSIDSAIRRASERGDQAFLNQYMMKASGRGPRTEWWPNEQFTDEDMSKMRQLGRADYLLTHDCSDHTPFQGRLKPDPESQLHRQKIDEVLKIVKPKIHFHGHMHTKYEWSNSRVLGYYDDEDCYRAGEVPIQTYGLEADFAAMHTYSSAMPLLNNWGVLDTETDVFAFRGEGMHFRSLDE